MLRCLQQQAQGPSHATDETPPAAEEPFCDATCSRSILMARQRA